MTVMIMKLKSLKINTLDFLENHRLVRQMLRFSVIGTTAFILDTLLFWIFIKCGINQNIALAMAFVMALPAFAADNKTIYLPEKMSWMTAGTEARNYCDFPTVRCHSVYPESGLDLFSTIRCRLKRDSVVISDIVHLSERSPDYTTITLKEGYEHVNSVTFQFSGNSNAAAYAVVSYHTY